MKKDPIDRLFEEKLKNFSEAPGENVWEAIQTSLDKKKRSRRIIPLWWKLGGAAAVLALLFYLLNPLAEIPGAENQVSDTETLEDPLETNGVAPGPDSLSPALPSDALVVRPEDSAPENTAETPSGRTTREAAGIAGETGGTARNAAEKGGVPVQNNAYPENVDREASLAAGSGGEAKRRHEQLGNNKSSEENNSRLNGLQQPQELAANSEQGDASDEQRQAGKPGLPELSEERPAEVAHDEEALESSGKKSIFDEIAGQEEEALAATGNARWSVGPRIAPVYFNSFGQGSPIHSNFVSNSKSGNVNFSYGLSLTYQVSPKISIRSGIHKVDYGYDTNDITFSPTLSAGPNEQINTIDYTLTSRNLVVRNSSDAKAVQDALSVEVAAANPARDGRMVQQFGYVEVPVELNVALVDRKLGVHLIGGVSSLFLVANSVTLESNGSATEMGEANNLNPMNFSTNVGFGVHYDVTPRFQLNLEPVFKYQLNTFSGAAGTFNPYSVGVYSGLSFKF